MPDILAPYSHRQLSTDTSIRLLYLDSTYGLRTGLRASLMEVKLSSAPPYEALSYTWGKQRDLSRTIRINGHEVPITNNLADALQAIRHPIATRVVWVDALSISQTDLDEKAQQVRMIGDIFSSAVRVLVWLGHHSGNSTLLFEKKKRKPVELLTDRSIPTKEGDSIARAWCDIAIREYWERTWIVQEIVLAKSIVLHCGTNTLTWEDITATFAGGERSTLMRHYLQLNQYEIFDQGLRRIRTLAERRSQEQQLRKLSPSNYAFLDIFNLIIACKDTKCFDKRDKVYALLSLSEQRTEIEVDYTIAVEDLFIRVFSTETRLSYDEFNQVAQSMGLHSMRGCYKITSALLQGDQIQPHITVNLASFVLRSVHRIICIDENGAAGLDRFHTHERRVSKLTNQDDLSAEAVKLKQKLESLPGNQDFKQARVDEKARSTEVET